MMRQVSRFTVLGVAIVGLGWSAVASAGFAVLYSQTWDVNGDQKPAGATSGGSPLRMPDYPECGFYGWAENGDLSPITCSVNNHVLTAVCPPGKNVGVAIKGTSLYGGSIDWSKGPINISTVLQQTPASPVTWHGLKGSWDDTAPGPDNYEYVWTYGSMGGLGLQFFGEGGVNGRIERWDNQPYFIYPQPVKLLQTITKLAEASYQVVWSCTSTDGATFWGSWTTTVVAMPLGDMTFKHTNPGSFSIGAVTVTQGTPPPKGTLILIE